MPIPDVSDFGRVPHSIEYYMCFHSCGSCGVNVTMSARVPPYKGCRNDADTPIGSWTGSCSLDLAEHKLSIEVTFGLSD